MQLYTLGFIFNSTLDKVLLMHKLRPAWQTGKINGLGGKHEEGEDSITCIVREIKEETGLTTNKDTWILLGNLYSDEWHSDVFAYIYEGREDDAKSQEEQTIEWFEVDELPRNVMGNLTWLIPLALQKIRDKNFVTFSAAYIAS